MKIYFSTGSGALPPTLERLRHAACDREAKPSSICNKMMMSMALILYLSLYL